MPSQQFGATKPIQSQASRILFRPPNDATTVLWQAEGKTVPHSMSLGGCGQPSHAGREIRFQGMHNIVDDISKRWTIVSAFDATMVWC